MSGHTACCLLLSPIPDNIDYCQKVYQPTLYFFFPNHSVECGGKSAGLLCGKKEKEGSQLSEFLVMADGGRSDRLKEESLPTCSSSPGRGNRQWWTPWVEKLYNSNAQADLRRLLTVTSAHGLSFQSSSAVCLFISQSQTTGHDFFSDVHCHQWFSLYLTSCQSHNCPLWERHTHTDQLTYWQNGE